MHICTQVTDESDSGSVCAEIEEVGLESAENSGYFFEVAHVLSSEDFQGLDHQTTSLSELESQTTKATGEISVTNDRNKQPIGPKSPYQSHPKPKNTFVVDGPRQPKLLKFPVRNPKSKKTKCFHVSWYQKFHWLDYDVEKDAAFCYCCTKFSSKISSASSASSTFTRTGYTKWANALDSSKGFSQHERSELHRNSCARWMELKNIQEGKEMDIIQTHDNREYLRYLFKYILWFATNEVPMRADDETEESKNPGKWVSFIRLQLETNSTFRELHEKFTKTRSMDYTSKTSVNEIIKVIAEGIRQIIFAQIKDAGMFSTLIDESKDAAKREELALAVRYSAEKVVERFVELQKLDQFDAHTLKEHIKEVIGCIIDASEGSVVVSLGADGASVMSGEFAGVAELLRSEQFNWLIYVHCTAHRLNLLVNDLIKGSNLALDMMSTVNSLYTFFNHPKVREVYDTVHSELYHQSQIKHLAQQIDIRWGCKFEAVELLADKPDVILETLVRVTQNPKHDPKHVEQASGFYHKLTTAKQIIGLITLHAYLAEMFFLSKELRRQSNNWTDVQYEVERTRKSVSKMDDDQIKEKVNEYSSNTGIPLGLTMPIHRTRSSSSSASTAELINSIITDLNSYMKNKIEEEFQIRFDCKNFQIMKAFEALDASKPSYLDINTLDYLVKHFDCLNINRSILKLELLRAKEDFQLGLPISENRSDNLMKLVKLKNTIATSTATVERCFLQ